MRSLLVVNDEPVLGQFADLRQRLEEMRIEHLGAIAAIEALNEGVLIGLSRLDVVEIDPAFVSPSRPGPGRSAPARCSCEASWAGRAAR